MQTDSLPLADKEFLDKDAKFLFNQSGKVLQTAKETDATPFDVSKVEPGHHGEECSFDAIVKKYVFGKCVSFYGYLSFSV